MAGLLTYSLKGAFPFHPPTMKLRRISSFLSGHPPSLKIWWVIVA